MKLREALLTGLPIRKKAPGNTFHKYTSATLFTIDNIIRHDWEVKEEKRELTLREIKKAVLDILHEPHDLEEDELIDLRVLLGFKGENS